MQDSSGDFIDVTNEVGTSGKFLELARNGQLVPTSEAIQERVRIARKLAEVEAKLRACNDPAKLAEFEKRYRKGGRNFESRLKELAANLEAQKSQLLAKMQQIDQQLVELGAEWTVDPAPMTSLVPRLVKKSDPSVAERNEVIDSHLDLSDMEICRLLDLHFARDGRVSCEHFPKNWERDYGVHAFTEAYRRPECRNRVHKLISVRRCLRSYPKA